MTRTERIYYLVLGLYHGSWSFLGPVYPLFLLDRGLDLLQVNVVLAVYFVTVLIFEVPTGAVADRFGRKASFLLSCAIRSVAFALYWTSESFAAFMAAEFIDALGTTLATGAIDAWAVDGMRAEASRTPGNRLFSNGHVVARAMMIASGLAGGYLAEHDIALPWLFGSAGFVTTGIVGALLMRETRRGDPALEHPSLAGTIRDSVALLRRTKSLQLLCMLTGATAFAHMPAMLLWPPRVTEITGREMSLMGWVWVLLNLVALLSSVAAGRMHPDGRAGRLLAVFTVMRAFALGGAAFATDLPPVIAGILVLEAGFALSEPLLQARMSDGAPPERRATILSLRSLSFTSGGALGLVTLGLLARGFDIATTWLACATVLALIAPAFRRLDTRRRPAIDEPRERLIA
jgi:MFS family permease